MNKITGVAIKRGGVIYALGAPNRHGDVIVEMVKFGVPKPVTKDAIQGFIGKDGKFLDRLEALELVKKNGQNIRPLERPQLYSEDIW